MKKALLMVVLVLAGLLAFEPAPVFCVYCAGGTPCFSNVDCSAGCRCQAPPYFQGVCVPQY
ncbi:MAG TPA: hypothetical protein VJR29_02190 [bacterium]|nr:hypothetical protein [bacterium]